MFARLDLLKTRPSELSNYGFVLAEMAARMQSGTLQADGSIKVEPTIDPDHVARAVVYMATLPLDANVPFMTIMATKMPYIGRG